MTGESSTSAELRAAERERDEALTQFEQVYSDLAEARFQLKEVRSDLADEQKAFAASQGDLSRMEEYRNTLERKLSDADTAHDRTRAELASARQELQTLRARDNDGQRAARLILDALGVDPDDDHPLMAARQMRAELDELRDGRLWQVASQDHGVPCASCSQPIVRGQAFQPLADAKGHFAHVYCNTEEPRS